MSKQTAYPDEQPLADRKPVFKSFSIGEIIEREHKPDVIPHNTMRFDVHMAHIHPLMETCNVSKEQIANAISAAIEAAVNAVIGKGLDGIPIPGGIDRIIHPKSIMLHRETLSCDLS